MSQPTTLLFDFDGTLADTLESTICIYNRLADKKGFAKVTDGNREALRGQGAGAVMRTLGIRPHQVPFVLRTIRRQLKREIGDLKPVAGMPALLSRLQSQGCRLGIVTSNAEENVRAFLEQHGLECFSLLRSGSSLSGKDRVLLSALKEHGLTPEKAVYIGDETRDVEAAKKAGLRVVAVTWGFNTEEALQAAGADFLVRSPGEIAAVTGDL